VTPEEKAGWVDHLDRCHGKLLDTHSESDVKRTLCLVAHSLAALLRLEADRMRVSADLKHPRQMELFEDNG